MSDMNNLEGMPRPSEQVLGFLRAGEKLQAVKLYKEETGCDLKTAMDRVTDIEAQLKGTDQPQSSPSDGQHSYNKGGRSGCLSLLVGGFLLIVLACVL